tara:strand:- start:153 stop:890 length:738 start_codon:yes stop_codon:yes gene_type:complete
MKNKSSILAIILAAGKGTRLESDAPKSLFKVKGTPIIDYLIEALTFNGDIDILSVVGYKKDQVIKHIRNRSIYITQDEQLGTGHAALQCKKEIANYDNIFILVGDTPFISSKHIETMLKKHKEENSDCTFLYSKFPFHLPYGRLIFNNKSILLELLEEHKTDEITANVRDYFTSQYLFRSDVLLKLLDKIAPDEITGEYNLTDTINFAIESNYKITPVFVQNYWSLMGINSKEDLDIILSRKYNV